MSELMNSGKEAGLRTLLQGALDELGHVVDAVDHQHNTKPGFLKYGKPYAAITSARKVREDCLIQASMWGLDISPTRDSPSPAANADDWQAIDSAPKRGEEILAEIQFRFHKGFLVIHRAHSDGDGEQPAFGPAWFYRCGDGYAELTAIPLRWKSIGGSRG